MRCSCSIPRKLKHLFFFFLVIICSFCQVQNQSVWKVCAPLPCQTRITCLPIDHGDAESSGMSILKRREKLGSQKPIKCTSNLFPTSRNSVHLWRLGAGLSLFMTHCRSSPNLQNSCSIISLFPPATNTYNSSKFKWTFPLCLSAANHII